MIAPSEFDEQQPVTAPAHEAEALPIFGIRLRTETSTTLVTLYFWPQHHTQHWCGEPPLETTLLVTVLT